MTMDILGIYDSVFGQAANIYDKGIESRQNKARLLAAMNKGSEDDNTTILEDMLEGGLKGGGLGINLADIMMKGNAKKGYNKGTSHVSRSKAKQMLSDNSAHGHSLTKKQKGYFGIIAGGGTPRKMNEGGQVKDTIPAMLENDSVFLEVSRRD